MRSMPIPVRNRTAASSAGDLRERWRAELAPPVRSHQIHPAIVEGNWIPGGKPPDHPGTPRDQRPIDEDKAGSESRTHPLVPARDKRVQPAPPHVHGNGARGLTARDHETSRPFAAPHASRSCRHPFENCTWLTTIVARTPRCTHGKVTVGNSSVSVATSPSCSSRSATRFTPVEVLGTNTISSAVAPTKAATRARADSREASHRSQPPKPSASSSRWKHVTA